jgi:hypothetical protein
MNRKTARAVVAWALVARVSQEGKAFSLPAEKP